MQLYDYLTAYCLYSRACVILGKLTSVLSSFSFKRSLGSFLLGREIVMHRG